MLNAKVKLQRCNGLSTLFLFVALSSDFSWSKEVQAKLCSVFQLSKFRPLQQAAINLSMSGKDLFLVMPTGRGKSLCYQLPALCSKGLCFHRHFGRWRTYFECFDMNSCACLCVFAGFTLVIAPLVSLMEDQLMSLKSINVSAVTLNASSTKVQYDRCTLYISVDVEFWFMFRCWYSCASAGGL